MTKVWILNYHAYGDVQVWDDSVDPLEIPAVKTELSYLEDGYEDVRADFMADLTATEAIGYGSAEIENRLVLELTHVINSFSVDMGLCGNCNKPVITTPFKSGLVHLSDMMRGCRAASFSVGAGWDDSLPRNWNAKLS